MKTITLMRHGKSSWEHDVSDRLRPLKKRGENDADLVAKYLFKYHNLAEDVFSSPARRALDTCRIVMTVFGLSEKSIKIEPDLYDFGGKGVINFIKNMPDHINHIMIFGHNHAFTSICNIFGDKFIDNLPTSGLVKLKFEIDNWMDLKRGTTEFIIIPKELKL